MRACSFQIPPSFEKTYAAPVGAPSSLISELEPTTIVLPSSATEIPKLFSVALFLGKNLATSSQSPVSTLRENTYAEGIDSNEKRKPSHCDASIKDLEPSQISSYFDEFKVNFACRSETGRLSLVKTALSTYLRDKEQLPNFNEASPSL